MALAASVFNGPNQKVVDLQYDERPDLVVIVEDDYGRVECHTPWGDVFDATELQRSLEAHRLGRATKIAEWEYQKKLSAEIVGHLNGAADPTGRMKWLPKLVYKRFLNDFHLRFPQLEAMVNDPGSADTEKVKAELGSIAFSWQKSP